MKFGRDKPSKTGASGGYTIGRDSKNGSFTHILIPGRGEVGVISDRSFKAAKEAAGYQIKNAHGRPNTPFKGKP